MDVDLKIDVFDSFVLPRPDEKNDIARFLFEHLEQYGDKLADINKAIEYALKERPSFGGKLFRGMVNNEIVGAVVINHTGMDGYIPENILVYIATHNEYRGKGIGKALMKFVIENTQGDIALHVEHDNPAKFLYDKLGFENKYLEMRLKKQK